MIKPEQVPMEVCEALQNALLAAFSKSQETTYNRIIAAALNAWPGMNAKAATDHVMLLNSTPALILPLAKKQEGCDGN